jgi:hypothetical protein
MRTLLAIAAAMLGCFATPVSAAFQVESISATLTITRDTLICLPTVLTPTCPEGFTRREVFEQPFSASGSFSLAIEQEGDTPLSQQRGDIGVFGTINNIGGILTGRDLTVSFRSTCRFGPNIGCVEQVGRASTFAVVGGIPEPSAWMLMLFGFGAIGYALRRHGKPGYAAIRAF